MLSGSQRYRQWPGDQHSRLLAEVRRRVRRHFVSACHWRYSHPHPLIRLMKRSVSLLCAFTARRCVQIVVKWFPKCIIIVSGSACLLKDSNHARVMHLARRAATVTQDSTRAHVQPPDPYRMPRAVGLCVSTDRISWIVTEDKFAAVRASWMF